MLVMHQVIILLVLSDDTHLIYVTPKKDVLDEMVQTQLNHFFH